MPQNTQHTLDIRSKKLMENLFVWKFKTTFGGKGIEFRDFQQYAPWDDAQYIDWVVSSRENTIISRRYQEEKQGNILCLVDHSTSLYFFPSKLSLVQELLNILSHASRVSGLNFWGYSIDGNTTHMFPPVRKHVYISKMMFSDTPNTLPISYDILLQKNLKRSIVFIISDRLDVDIRSLKKIALKHDVVYLHISADFENTLSGTGVFTARWARKVLWINLDNKKKKQLYRELRTQQKDTFAKQLHSIWVDVAFFDETRSVFQGLFELMNRR